MHLCTNDMTKERVTVISTTMMNLSMKLCLHIYLIVMNLTWTYSFSPSSSRLHKSAACIRFPADEASSSTTTTCFTGASFGTTTTTTSSSSFLCNSFSWKHQRQSNHDTFFSFRLCMSWGPEPEWTVAKVIANSDACPSGKSVAMTLQVDPEVYAEYTVPGQYVQLRCNEAMDKPEFMAIRSPPPLQSNTDDINISGSSPTFDFLIRKTDSLHWLTDLAKDASIQISQVLGNGYAVEENLNSLKYDFPTQNIVLLAAGSGIAPIAAVLDSASTFLQLPNRSCRLYYGEATADDLCCVDRFRDWENAGIEVVPVLSQPTTTTSSSSSSSPETWQGRVGYVQTALAEDGVPVPRNSAAFLCGPKGMSDAAKELLLEAGVFEGRILFNY